MISDTLTDIIEILKTETIHYTTGTFAKTYEDTVREEIDDIILRMKTLRNKLDKSDFEGSYKFNK